MKIATWNVNSVRARQDQLRDWLVAAGPDVVALQETKIEDGLFRRDVFKKAGYRSKVHGQKTYNGVAVFSRERIELVGAGFRDGGNDEEARFLDVETMGIRVLCCYVPNGQSPDSDKFTYKLEWLARLRRYLDEHCDPEKPLAVMGDFNIAPDERDLHDPEAQRELTHFHPDEHAALAEITGWGLVDALRLHHEEGGIYSWWDYRQMAFQRNLGMRIDLILLSAPLAERCTDVVVDKSPRHGAGAGTKPSDHTPVIAELRD